MNAHAEAHAATMRKTCETIATTSGKFPLPPRLGYRGRPGADLILAWALNDGGPRPSKDASDDRQSDTRRPGPC